MAHRSQGILPLKGMKNILEKAVKWASTWMQSGVHHGMDTQYPCWSRSWPLLSRKACVFCRTLSSPAHVLPLGLWVPQWARDREEPSWHLQAPGPVTVRGCAGDLPDITGAFPGTDTNLGREGSPPPLELLTQNDLKLWLLMPIFSHYKGKNYQQ